MNAEALVFDIETVGVAIDDHPINQENKDYLRGKIEKKRAVKDDERTDLDKEKDFCGLDVDLAKVVCISTFDGEQSRTMTIQNTDLERDIIEWFWGILRDQKPQRIVSFNGKNFDLPIIVRRSMLYNLKPTTKHISLEKYDSLFHYDLADYLGNYQTPLKRLDFYCDLYGITKESGGFKGDEIRGLFEQGKTQDIATKCEGDVKATYELYKKVKPYIRK